MDINNISPSQLLLSLYGREKLRLQISEDPKFDPATSVNGCDTDLCISHYTETFNNLETKPDGIRCIGSGFLSEAMFFWLSTLYGLPSENWIVCPTSPSNDRWKGVDLIFKKNTGCLSIGRRKINNLNVDLTQDCTNSREVKASKKKDNVAILFLPVDWYEFRAMTLSCSEVMVKRGSKALDYRSIGYRDVKLTEDLKDWWFEVLGKIANVSMNVESSEYEKGVQKVLTA